MEQWLEWLTRPATEDEVPNIDRIISVFTGTKNDDGKSEPGINSWEKPLCDLNDLLNKRCNLKGTLMLCTYRWPDGLK